MRILETILLILIFSLGMVAHGLITELFYVDVQKTFSVGFRGTSAPEQLSPSDHIKESQIKVFQQEVVLDVKNATWASFTDTNSMDPLLDSSSNGIEIIPTLESEVKVGDIVSYSTDLTTGYIIHRVIDKGIDEFGTYYILKGDNNANEDPQKVRFKQIHGVLVAVIY